MKNRMWNLSGALGVTLAGTCLLLGACSALVKSSGSGGGTPAAALSPGSLSFASQTVNTTSAAQSVTLTNSGSAALSLTSIAITGTNSGDFAATNTCGSSVNANATCTVSVTFTPTAAGSRTANVSITDNATGSPQTVSLTGTGASGNGTPAVTLSPTSLTFASQTVNTTSAAQSITLTNSGTATLSITSIAITGTNSGDFAETNTCGSSVNANATCTVSVTFTPTAAGSRTANVSITDNATGSPQTVSLTGTGASGNGTPAVTLSPTSLTFASQTVNTTSAAQSVTLTNSGTATLNITSITITGTNTGDFAQTNTCGTSVTASGTCAISVTFTPTAAGSRTASVSITDDATGSPQTVSLTGTGTSASGGSLSITTTSIPVATASSQYLAFLQASGGTAPYTWSSSNVPSGLSIATSNGSGIIEGTAPAATASFTVQVTDSAIPAATASATFSLTVDATTGANCNTIFIDVGTASLPPTPPLYTTDTGTHVLPLNDLGAGTYQSQQGGLYPSGSNTRPSAHDTAGLNLAGQIQALDANGNPSATGKYVLITIGMSNNLIESTQFLTDAAADSAVNSTNLVLVNGAENGKDANQLADITNSYWTTNIPNALSGKSVTAKQVVAAWVKDADASPQGTFPTGDATTLKNNLEKIAQNLLTTFPNIKLAYYSSRIYAGYATSGLNPEPFAYESGFSVKWTVQDQINGVALNFDSSKGTVVSPWIAWGPYLWANGYIPRSDGIIYTCQDLRNDGAHPSSSGAEQVSQMLLKFFKTDSTTKGWFCATGKCP